MRTLWHGLAMGLAALMSVAAGTPAAAAETEYRIPALTDFSGPFADVTKHLVARDAVVKWWSDTEGKKLGIKLTGKS